MLYIGDSTCLFEWDSKSVQLSEPQSRLLLVLTWAPAYQTEALYLAVANFLLLGSVSVANKAHGVGYSAGISWSMAADDLGIGSIYGFT